MKYTYLEIQLPRISDEQAAVFQQLFYAVTDAFDTQYIHAIERYYQSCSEQQCDYSQILKELLPKEDHP